VIGFVLTVKGETKHEVYITGDTVFYEGVETVAKKYTPDLIFLFAGAARTRGPRYRLKILKAGVLEKLF